ncbi:hypothetical protein [Amaricoccus sp.]|uniref:hypothetical protein n=1 Tax=Amaricoccus sp. TaxID=1872485 RepID=UPI001B690DBC|nr:hypothetical protein [Amaricoccus sp.]MBP7002115.1 hypothetical protein [Amaricoccus sp.]
MLTFLDGFAGLQAVLHGRLLQERRRRPPEVRAETIGPFARYHPLPTQTRETRS